jgi:F0F1-type ATP synthase assembly protein I
MSEAGKSKLYKFMAVAAVVFLSTAIGATLLGRFLDSTLNMAPFGSLLVLIMSYVVAWVMILRLRKNLLKK